MWKFFPPVVPQVTDEIQDWVTRVAEIPVNKNDEVKPEICIIELGGTIGDIESLPFIEAFRRLQVREKQKFCCVHVTLIPQV